MSSLRDTLKWFSEINLCSLIVSNILFCFILITSFSLDNYLQNSFNSNINKGFIKNITFTKENCSTNQELAIIGLWSGIKNGCYCYDKSYKSKVFEKVCEQVPESSNSKYICKNINDINDINITKYKNFSICLERSDLNYVKFYDEVLKYNNTITDLNKLKNVLKNNSNVKFPIDFKILNTSNILLSEVEAKFNHDMSDYENQTLDTNYTLYVKYKNIDEIENPKQLEDLIVDISLYNYIWCSYLDLAPTVESLPKNEIDFKYESCNKLYRHSSYIYNDKNKRMEYMNFMFDNTISKSDFYDNTIINKLGSILSINPKYQSYLDGVLRGQLEPVLTYEKLWPGLFCDKFTDTKDVIKNYNNLNTLNIISWIIVLLQLGMFLSIIFRFIAKKLDLNNFINIFQIIILLKAMCGAGLSILFYVTCKITVNFFKDFQTRCQVDSLRININSNKVGPLEKELVNGIESLLIYSSILFIFYILKTIYIVFIIFSCIKCSTNIEEGAGKIKKRESELSNFAF